jgi:arylformamidase
MGRPDDALPVSWFEGSWIDITRPLSDTTPVWPGDMPFRLHTKLAGTMVLSSFSTTCHVGTHVDAPLHLDAGAGGVGSIEMSRLVGVAEVVAAEGAGRTIGIDDLTAGWSPNSKRVLIRTDSHPLGAAIGSGFRALEPETVHWLADRGVELIGVDVPSVDPYEADELLAHRALMQRGVTWIEGLWLGSAAPARYFLVALPMLLVDAEAAPVRAILRPLPPSGAGRTS